MDATNVERNLYLTMQLMELGMPMVLALNMMDEVEGNGGTIHVNEMEKLLGIPVIPISASKNEGTAELVDHALHVARFQEPPVRQDFCAPDEHDGAVHRCLHSIMALIEDHAERAGIPPRFAASKLAEGDQLVLDAARPRPEREGRARAHHLPDGGRTRPRPRGGHRRHAVQLHRPRVRANGGEADRESRARAQHAPSTSC